MARAVALTHVTAYRYDRPVRLGPQVIRLSPAPHAPGIRRHAVRVDPGNHRLHHRRDASGNPELRAVFDAPVTGLTVTATLEVELTPVNPFDFLLDAGAERLPVAYPPLLAAELAPCLRADPPGPGLAALLPDPRAPGDALPTILALAARVAGTIRYLRRDEPGILEPEEVIARAEGSCRDTAWLLAHALRAAGVAARFVSGYLLDPDAGAGAGTAELHAWTEAFLPGAGWIGIDPTSGLLAAEFHIPLAAASHPSLAAPLSGTLEPCEVAFTTEMTLEPA